MAPLGEGNYEPKIITLADEICTLNLIQLADLSTVLKVRRRSGRAP